MTTIANLHGTRKISRDYTNKRIGIVGINIPYGRNCLERKR